MRCCIALLAIAVLLVFPVAIGTPVEIASIAPLCAAASTVIYEQPGAPPDPTLSSALLRGPPSSR